MQSKTQNGETSAPPKSDDTSMALETVNKQAVTLEGFLSLAPSGAHIVNIGDAMLDSEGKHRRNKAGELMYHSTQKYTIPSLAELRERKENKGLDDEQLTEKQNEIAESIGDLAAEMHTRVRRKGSKAICDRVTMSEKRLSMSYKIAGERDLAVIISLKKGCTVAKARKLLAALSK